MGAIAAQFGQPLMPWQQQVADVGLELLPDGRPAYREVAVTVPRQSGKTTLILGVELQRALGWTQILGQPQRITYSAQTGKDAREKLLEDQVPLLTRHKRLFGIQQFMRAFGSEAVIWVNGSRMTLLASSQDSGHGKTLDLGVKDELFADTDMRRDQSMNPAMATRPHAQLWTASTMGTVESIALNSVVEQGRLAVETGRDTGVAYFEWSAHPDEDPADPATWWGCMPALGRTISLPVVEHAFQTLPLGEFRRAYTNVMTLADERVIPYQAWAAVCQPDIESSGEMFAVDVNPERTAAGIIAVGLGAVIEVVEYRPGTGWLVERCAELHQKYQAPFVIDPKGPAAHYRENLTQRGIRLVDLPSGELAEACASFYDRVIAGTLHIRTNTDLDAAAAGATKRPVGDMFIWGRKTSRYDISLLMAATIGLWAMEHDKGPVIPSAMYV